jgi:hypothetical protein
VAIKRVARSKVVRYALEALIRFPQTVSEPLIKVVLRKVWRRETGSIRPTAEAVKSFSESTSRNCQERFLGNLVLKGLIDNRRGSRTFCRAPGAYPIHRDALTLIEDLEDDLDKYSEAVHQLYALVWEAWERPEKELV